MGVRIVFALLAFCGLVCSGQAEIQTRLVNLRLDHFNPLDTRNFDARYFENSEHYFAGGPLFIYVGGGIEFYEDFLERGAVFEIARDTRGHLFSLEHRFFGSSRPTEDTSVENLRFLTIQQTLADLAQFINFIRGNYYGAQSSRVILWGRGYGGSLAVWARQKYPHLVDGVWASSAPINAVLEYPELMRNTFATISSIGGNECGEVLNEAFQFIENAIRLRNTSYVEQRLNLCDPIDNVDEELSRLFYGIASDLAYTFVSNARYPEIDEKCMIMRGLNDPQSPPENALDAFARWFVDEFKRNYECLEYTNKNFVNRYSNIDWDSVSTIGGRRQNFWLQCTQLGQFGVSNNGERHPFGWRFDVDFFRLWCGQIFDENL
jgi:thymus-specific serine protease